MRAKDKMYEYEQWNEKNPAGFGFGKGFGRGFRGDYPDGEQGVERGNPQWPDKAYPETGAGYGSERERKGTSNCIKMKE